MKDISKMNDDFVRFSTDDLIYNRFDLIYADNVERLLYQCENQKYVIDVHYEKFQAVLNIWGKCFPQNVFEEAIDDIFSNHSEIQFIEIKRAGNNYKNMLNECNDIRVPIPGSQELLLQTLKAKHRYAIKRNKRLLEDEYGKLEVVLYKAEIPDEIVELYFDWKKETHGTDYLLSPKEYLEKYHVSDGMLLRAGTDNIGILFFCQVNHTVYLENFSYNTEMEKMSPGYLIYVMFLEELIRRHCSYLYLGGGEYLYKKRFGAEELRAYSGIIYSEKVFENLNFFWERNNIKRIAIYGLGAIGQAFLKVENRLEVELIYGIDREKKKIAGVKAFCPEDDLEPVDAVIITLKYRNKEVEDFLQSKFRNVYYWNDIVMKNLMKEA